jgi:hypothetical protein
MIEHRQNKNAKLFLWFIENQPVHDFHHSQFGERICSSVSLTVSPCIAMFLYFYRSVFQIRSSSAEGW